MKARTIIEGITHEDLVNLFSTALYGSFNFSATYDHEEYRELTDISDDDCFEDKLARLLLAGKAIEIRDYNAEDETDVYGTLKHIFDDEGLYMAYFVTLDDIKRGIEACYDSVEHYVFAQRLMDEDADQLDAENVLQYIIFSELIYG